MNNLIFIRTKNNLNQNDIAKILNVKRNTYSQYESKTISLSIKQVCILADYYNVSTDFILGNTDSFTIHDRSNNELSMNILPLRKAKGFTQKEMASLLGVSTITYLRYEKKLTSIPTDILVKISKILNTSIDFLLNRTEDINPY